MNRADLDTQDNPSRSFRDETERVKCSKCGNYFRLGFGMMADGHVPAISLRHLDYVPPVFGR